MAIAILGQILQQGVLRVMALQYHQTRLAGATGTTRYLGIELGQLFGGPKIGAEQGAIHIQQSYQCHVRKVMALGQHLGTDQDLVLARLDVAEMGLQLPFAAGVVPIDAHHRVLRKNRGEQLLKLLGADTWADQFAAATLGTMMG